MPDPKGKGRFVWFDLMTRDTEGAIEFYKSVADWGTTLWEGGPQPYTMWTTAETPLGGVMLLPPDVEAAGSPPHWLAYIGTPDTNATAKRAEQLGGKVHSPPMDIPTVGRFAVLADPQGAVFAVFTAAEETPGHEGPPAIGEFSWHELATTDYESAFSFYADLFGWDKTEAMDSPAGTYQMYGRNGTSMGGMFNKPAEMPGPPAWLHYIRVDDVRKRVETVKRLGGTVLNGPMEVPGGDLIAQCSDPQGAMFAIHSTATK